MKNKTLAMFPGQGSQFVGMGKEIVEQFPYTSQVFEEAEDYSKLPLRKLCFEGPEDQLKMTEITQPAILVASIAAWKVLRSEAEFEPDCFAGHSLGEYSALVAAERISFGAAAALVRKRGRAMQEAVPAGVGAMAAVMKVPAEELALACKEASRDGSVVEIANYNSPQQLVVAGHAEAVDRVIEDLTGQKKRCVKLPVSAPFHSSLMAPAREEMTEMLNATEFQQRSTGMFANITGSLVDKYEAQHLIEQIDSSVKWTQTMEASLEENIRTYVEIGPGRVLSSLARRMLPRDGIKVVSSDGGLKDLIEALS